MCGSAPKPDKNIGIAQQKIADLATRQQNYFESNFAPKLLSQMDQSLAIAKLQADKQNEAQDYQTAAAKRYDDRYWGVQVPLEDQLISKAKLYNEDAEQERMAQQAGEDVAAAGLQGRGQLMRQLMARGINPNSPAAIAALTSTQTAQDLAKASAINKTREAARLMGWTRLGEAAALGRGLPSFGATSASLATGAGQAALGAGAAGVGLVGSAAGTVNNAYGTTAGMWGQVGQLGVQKSQIQSQSSGSGIGGLVGGIAGSFLGPLGSAAGAKLGDWAFGANKTAAV